MNGKRIVITRSPHQAAAFAQKLTALGAVPILQPTIEILRVDSSPRLNPPYDGLIFTSANAVDFGWQYLTEIPPFVAAIGTGTAEALRLREITPSVIAKNQTAEGLFAAIMEQGVKNKFLLPRGDLARPTLKNLFLAVGASVDDPIVYRTVPAALNPTFIHQPFDAITFTSPSTVQNFCALVPNFRSIIGEAAVVCIGTTTALAVQHAGLQVQAVATPHTIDGLIEALAFVFEREK